MWKGEQSFFAVGLPAAVDTGGRARKTPLHQHVRGVAGQLRPYRDVRAGFEPWRRIALRAWAEDEEAAVVH